MPIKNLNNEVIAIAQIINKTSTNGKCTLNSFNENDIQVSKFAIILEIKIGIDSFVI